MAFNRYLKREKYKRQFTFSKTKAVIGFILSVIVSVSLSAYFDRYGPVIMKHMKEIFSRSSDTLTSIPELKPRAITRYEEEQQRGLRPSQGQNE